MLLLENLTCGCVRVDIIPLKCIEARSSWSKWKINESLMLIIDRNMKIVWCLTIVAPCIFNHLTLLYVITHYLRGAKVQVIPCLCNIVTPMHLDKSRCMGNFWIWMFPRGGKVLQHGGKTCGWKWLKKSNCGYGGNSTFKKTLKRFV